MYDEMPLERKKSMVMEGIHRNRVFVFHRGENEIQLFCDEY